MFENESIINKIQPVPEDINIKEKKVLNYEVSDEEQQEAFEYVNKKELNRPTTGFLSFLKHTAILMTSAFGITVLTLIILKRNLTDIYLYLNNLI